MKKERVKPHAIDVHNHIFPDFYSKTMKEELGIADCGGAPWPKWSLKALIKMMDSKGIEKAFMSYPVPGVHFKNDEWSRAFARKCNEYMAETVGKYPNRLGGFACLPLPDLKGSLEEADYALDTLILNGIGLLSNVNGVYPGTEKNRELFKELNKRKVVVFIHPNDPVSEATKKFHNIFYEWFVETSKTAIGISRAGFINDFPNIKYILAHAGGVYPAFAHLLMDLKAPMLGNSFFVGTAKSVDSHNLNRLFSEISPDQVVFGSDYPMANSTKIDYWFKKLQEYFQGKDAKLADIFNKNVQAIIPVKIKSEEEVTK